jgi:RNA polymerase sigma-70 factor, ECF subfamily
MLEQKPSILPIDHTPETLRGDKHAETFSRHRDLLFSIAYRMLGSASDAEDMVQETFIRWQQVSDGDIRSPRAFLVTVLSRLCIQHLQSARAKREEYVGQWLPEPMLTYHGSDPYDKSQVHESLSMAFLLLLEKLTPAERAAFLLHEVFEYDYAQIAEILSKTEPNCRQLVRRARQHVTLGRPRFDASPEKHRTLLDEFLAATASGDLTRLVALLSNEVVLYSDGGGKQRAALHPIIGRNAVARFLLGSLRKTLPGVSHRIDEVNGRPSLVYLSPRGVAGCVIAFDLCEKGIGNIYVVTNPDKLAHVGSIDEIVHLT